MDVAEWIIVAILSMTLLVFLIVGIVLMVKLLSVADEARRVAIRSQDLADNANDVVSNVNGLTSVGGVVQTFVDKYIEQKAKAKEGSSKNGRRSTKE